MKKDHHSVGLTATLVALGLAVLTVWQLPAALGVTDQPLLIASQGLSVVLVAAFARDSVLLLRE